MKYPPVLLIFLIAAIAAFKVSSRNDTRAGVPLINYDVKPPIELHPSRDPITSHPEPSLSPQAKKNPAFPVGVNELVSVSTLEYIERYSKTAQQEWRSHGVPASISLAQGIIESRAGNSKLAKSNNNHFGMKCFSKHCKKGHCTNFTDDSHKDFFLNFSTASSSWEAHAKLLSSGRYTKLHRYGKDYRAWAHGLKSIGYATDRTYANKLIGVIERYELYKYDR